jgi:hypothetical protein
MLRLPAKLRHDAAADFIGSTVATRILREQTPEQTSGIDNERCVSADDIDAGGLAVVTGVLDESIWPYLYANAAEKLHGGPSSFLATLFDTLKPLNLPPPPPPKKRKKWVPGRFLDPSNRKWLGKLLLAAGAALVAGAVIAAIIILAEPLMKLFSFIGNLLLMAGGFIGSVIMAIAQCMADHGLACPLHGIVMLLKGGVKLAMSIGGWVFKGIGKFFGKILMGVMALGGFALGKLGSLFKGIWFGVGKLFKMAWKGLGMVFEKIWAGILGLAGFLFGAIKKFLVKGFGLFISLFKKINLGGIIMGLAMGIGAIGMGIGKLALAVPKLIVAGLKGFGKMVVKIGMSLGAMPKFIFSGITLGLASLGKLAVNFTNPIKSFFLKGLPKFFEWLLAGPSALLLSVGVGLGDFFDKLGDMKIGMPSFSMPNFAMPGLGGIGELMLSIGGVIGKLLLGFGSIFINVMAFGANMAMFILKAGWKFAGMALKMLGPLIVKFFEGIMWLAKAIYDGLGNLVLGAIALVAAGFKALGVGLKKLFTKLLPGGFKLVIGALKGLGKLVGKGFLAIGKLFKNMALGAYNLSVGLGGLIGNVMVKLGKFGLSSFSIILRGLAYFIPVVFKTLGVAFKSFFSLVWRGLALGFSFTMKGFKVFGNMMLALGFTLGKMAFKLPDFTLKGLKLLWGAIKMGGIALGKFMVGFGKAMLWMLKDPRRLLTALVLLAYVAFLCFGMGYCQKFNYEPAWGTVPPPDNAGYRPSRLGWKIRGGKGKFKFSWPGWPGGKKVRHKWMEIMVPFMGEAQVREAEALANGKDLFSHPRIYSKVDKVKWDRNIGEIQTVETDKSGYIVSTDIASNDYWNCGPPRQRQRTVSRKHPFIQLSEPVSGIRVQLFDVESGELNWDATYQLKRPGILDASAKEVTGKMSWSTDGGTVPGFRGKFNRLCIPAGDETDHEFELLVTRYPPYTHTDDNVSADHLNEQNKLGTAHYKSWVVSDPRAPSEEAAKKDSKQLRSVGQNIGLAGAIITIVPPTQTSDCRSQKRDSPIYQHWRRERHRQFWMADSQAPRVSSSYFSARRHANFFS